MCVGGFGGSKSFFFEIQPDLVCELLTQIAHATTHFFESPASLGHEEGAKRSNNIIKSQLQSISKIFKPNLVCLLTNERYKTY